MNPINFTFGLALGILFGFVAFAIILSRSVAGHKDARDEVKKSNEASRNQSRN